MCVSSVVCSCAVNDAADDADRTEQVQEKASVEVISLPLLTKMSSERTLAVQAALDAATGQIPGTAGMDALPECVWQRSLQQSRKNSSGM